VYQNDRTTICT